MDADTKETMSLEKVAPDEASIAQTLHIDPEKEKKLLRKLDIYIAPIMTIIFLTAYLDRSNIGNAASAGMTDDLGMTSSQLGSMCNHQVLQSPSH